jgi:hypothetical protein
MDRVEATLEQMDKRLESIEKRMSSLEERNGLTLALPIWKIAWPVSFAGP